MNVYIETKEGAIIGVYVDGHKVPCCSGYVIIDRDQQDSSDGICGPFPMGDIGDLDIEAETISSYDRTP